MRAFQRLETQLLAQRGHLFCWVPVCLGIGIGGYFALRFEPDVLVFLGLGCLLALGLILARIVRVAFAPLLVGLVLIGAKAFIILLITSISFTNMRWSLSSWKKPTSAISVLKKPENTGDRTPNPEKTLPIEIEA